MMGQYTQYPAASYSAHDADAMIEILRRVPDAGMLINLNLPDTQRMITWLEEARAGDFLAQAARWGLYRQHFEQHLNYLCGGTERALTEWPDDMIKLFLVAWWVMVSCEERPEVADTFGKESMKFAATSYSGFAEALDVELI